jgi:hypothetical protein
MKPSLPYKNTKKREKIKTDFEYKAGESYKLYSYISFIDGFFSSALEYIEFDILLNFKHLIYFFLKFSLISKFIQQQFCLVSI